jgi:hypothetical protein
LRFDRIIAFITKEATGEYDPDLGEYKDAEEESEIRICHVHDLKTERTLQVFGRADVQALEVIHQGEVVDAKTARLDGKEYHVISKRQLRGKASYIFRE